MIAGLELPNEGEISIGERLVSNLPPEYRDIGYVFQEYALFPHMDVWNNVTYGPRVKGWEEKKSNKIGREMLELVRLFERTDAFPAELSGGMRQRVALARALASGSKLLLLDEPLGALDARIRTDLRYEIRKLVKDLGLTAIHVTHDQAEAMAISDRIAVMQEGKDFAGWDSSGTVFDVLSTYLWRILLGNQISWKVMLPKMLNINLRWSFVEAFLLNP